MEMIPLIEIADTEMFNPLERHRFDVVFCTIKAPLYFWVEILNVCDFTIDLTALLKEVCNREFVIEDFSYEYLSNDWDNEEDYNVVVPFYNNEYGNSSMEVFNFILDYLNCYRINYLTTGNEKWLQHIIQLLPINYNITKRVSFTYETLKLICSRKYHSSEWIDFMTWYNELFKKRNEENGKI